MKREAVRGEMHMVVTIYPTDSDTCIWDEDKRQLEIHMLAQPIAVDLSETFQDEKFRQLAYDQLIEVVKLQALYNRTK